MPLYNDGYSAHAVFLGTALANDEAKAVFTQNGTNNLLATDTVQLGNQTWTVVAAIGATPGNVLKGANWNATLTNLIAGAVASGPGAVATANYVPFTTAANYFGELTAANIATFWADPLDTSGNALASVYTASGASGGSFGAANFSLGTPGVTRAIDISVAVGLSLQFEVIAPILNPAVFQVWSDIPSASNPCVPSGIAANQKEIMDSDICNPLTGALQPMVVTIPATVTVTDSNIQGFIQTQTISAVGSFYNGRPRCTGPGTFLFVKAVSGDTPNVNITALLSRLKYAS